MRLPNKTAISVQTVNRHIGEARIPVFREVVQGQVVQLRQRHPWSKKSAFKSPTIRNTSTLRPVSITPPYPTLKDSRKLHPIIITIIYTIIIIIINLVTDESTSSQTIRSVSKLSAELSAPFSSIFIKMSAKVAWRLGRKDGTPRIKRKEDARKA